MRVSFALDNLLLNFAELHDIQLIIPGSLYSNSQSKSATDALAPVQGGPLTQIDGNTDDSCYGVELNEEVSIGMCQNCHILETQEREWEQANDSDDEEMEGAHIS
ncbi:hypothetical protein NOF04DRAFT_19501 [Fusarium oxysporum II5]|uniref:Uncharacterized protein n=2 Tax=Fusarium oxysporum species complex TaxID=171631 RepID=X0IPF5_FUSO5|nr:uncharacterized protein FOIG_16041 [Fusarium odoratissimum NRRL 54006]EXL90747.1 hypothetical protein FOIG_16041 [Fusarium odoratissimum NRRL 54006]KAK2123219.1 hypothetical protein NOF04DRAFT_19501 [Fusarium oxysporum II5]TXB97566.1 hypothetical protein FocTR4_00011798 [Fusarium oxysporum f. sp. cubense]